METAARIAAVCLLGAVLTALMKKTSPDTALLLALAVCVAVLAALARGLEQVTDFLREHGPGIHHLNVRLADRENGIRTLKEDLHVPPFFDLYHLGRNCAYFDLRQQLGVVIEVGSRVVGPRASMSEEEIRRLTAY